MTRASIADVHELAESLLRVAGPLANWEAPSTLARAYRDGPRAYCLELVRIALVIELDAKERNQSAVSALAVAVRKQACNCIGAAE